MQGIANRVHVITGGYGGIALKTAAYLSGLGGIVVMTGRNLDRGNVAAADLSVATGNPVHFVAMDVRDSASTAAAADRIEAEIGPVYGVVANAAKAALGLALNTSDEDWRLIVGTNLDGVFYTTREFSKRMYERGGSMVLVSSIASRTSGHPRGFAAYGTSKAGVTHLARLLGVELGPAKIRVNAIEPGYTATNALTTLERDAPDVAAAILSTIPMHRFLKPEEIAQAIGFLLSDHSSAMTGSVLIADAGASAM